MYIKTISIKNVRAISEFRMQFNRPPGWHVLIGDNGAGKSTIIRSTALALIGELQAQGLAPNWDHWITSQARIASIRLDLEMDPKLDSFWRNSKQIKFERTPELRMETTLRRRAKEGFLVKDMLTPKGRATFPQSETDDWSGSFSVAYGPYRRFEGGSHEFERFFKHPFYGELAGHLTAFSESVALTEIVKWLMELHHKSLEGNKTSLSAIESLKLLINSPDFLPHKARLNRIGSDGVFFDDGNGVAISLNQMSDGYRSILSLTFELVRQLVRVYGADAVFRNIKKNKMTIDVPGIVLIDEIDAHLHPSWQTRIGGWFTKYFPALQFIVTTHSPLVCRAAKEGTIWRLTAPDIKGVSGEITGVDKDRLIFGNVLDAYGTDIFGPNITISRDSNEKRSMLASLNMKSLLGQITASENDQMEQLKALFPTEKLEIIL